MSVRVAITAAVLLAVGPAHAEMLNADGARRFVIGKLFAFNCFEGTHGAGRIYPDGSVMGSVQFRGQGPIRYAALPPGTLHVKGEAVCATVGGLPFQPCFNVNKTAPESFRGSVSGLNFAYCDFTHTQPRFVRSIAPRPLPSAPLPTQITAPRVLPSAPLPEQPTTTTAAAAVNEE